MFAESTNGSSDGRKPDGCGFHHWNNYEAYMYVYETIVKVLEKLRSTSFQIDETSYLNFRDLIMHKMYITNDSDLVCWSMTGRTGNWDNTKFSKKSLKSLAITGGKILGLNTADPILSGIYNRKYGIDKSFNYNSTYYESGFYQFNFANACVYKNKDTMILVKGFNNQFWGAEIYEKENRFGRYQGYGSITVINKGDRTKNGFSSNGWDWNFHPGCTTKVLEWSKLIAASVRVDEFNNKNFAGSLIFDKTNTPFLKGLIGKYGIFGMDFQERRNLGFSGSIFTDSHDESFTFKKSVFFFGDVILCLGSNISHNDKDHPAVTTLFQNCTEPNSFTVNDILCTNTEITNELSLVHNDWIIDNFNTGFYIIAGNGSLKFRRSKQATPSPTQTEPNKLNEKVEASLAFIDHGVNPKNQSYEYIIFPNTDRQKLLNFNYDFYNNKRPYHVIAKGTNSHIVYDYKTEIFGCVLFTPNQNIEGNLVLAGNNVPCLVMFQQKISTIKLTLSNPDVGLGKPRNLNPCPEKLIEIKLRGKWKLRNSVENVEELSSNEDFSLFSFKTRFGLPIEVTFLSGLVYESFPNWDEISVPTEFEEEREEINENISNEEHPSFFSTIFDGIENFFKNIFGS